MLCTVSESIALVPLLVSAGGFVDKRANYRGDREPWIVIPELQMVCVFRLSHLNVIENYPIKSNS